MSQISNLFRLQKIDTQVDQINLRFIQISDILSSDHSVNDAEITLDETKSTTELSKKKLKGLEEDLNSLQIKNEISEAALYGGKISNPKELKDIQEEISSFKRRITHIEDQILDAMEQTEICEQNQNIAQENLVKTQSVFATQKAILVAEQSQLISNRENLLSEHKATLNSISPENIDIYNRLRKIKRGIAVSSSEDGACNACGSSLRPEEIQIAHSSEQISYCSSCGRIIYAG
jgi:hypothetical protein